ncbi:cellulose biosynthesis protein BcsG [Aliidiomarina shirensis]|uniref:Cellulose biosynthesis protein BcsG n=1 Tax=Aliidiomarina shirensis TaxID=1048642 RepID=A0A432WQP3_9GAMM|nr:cellulose biosynthesis protein BcsG [Aliidiomarina shirensis]RUO35997.1 cellulose biosynthesis protein BcsG [Aliidiomarina shirensis]
MSDELYQRQRQQLLQHPLMSWPGLGAWSFYFLLKVALVSMNMIGFDLLLNLTLFVFLIIPAGPLWLKILRQVIAIPAAVALIYTESFLPPFERLISQWDLVSSFSAMYLLELVTRAVPIQSIAALLVAWILYLYLAKILRMTTVVLVAMLAFPLWQLDTAPQPNVQTAQAAQVAFSTNPEQRLATSNPDSTLASFYEQQADQQLSVSVRSQPNFDILMINICSVSWADLEQFELVDHPVLQQADILLSNFYTGSSYSGPATLRLLQASCGHSPHSEIFNAPAECKIGEQLAGVGYSREILMNHSGAFDNYLSQIRNSGGMGDAPFVNPEQFSQIMMGFDQSPIYSDAEVLNYWLEEEASQPKFSFYNTTSLHDGNRMPGFRGNSSNSYRTRLLNLLDDLNQLFEDIAASERQVLVVIVPEHGAGLAGDQFQLPGMREIPTPALTHVPVLIRLFGPGINEQRSSMISVSKSTSPIAITSAIYQIIEQNPFSGGSYAPQRVADNLPETRPVLENDRVIMMEYEGQFILQINNGEWRPYNR